jgi:hypothetical protein
MKSKTTKTDLSKFKLEGSVRCYVAELTCGSLSGTWTFSDLSPRQVCIFPDGKKKAAHLGKYYSLYSPEEMREILIKHFNASGIVIIGGNYLDTSKVKEITMFHFIDTTD